MNPVITLNTLHHFGIKIFIGIAFLTQGTIVAQVPVFSTRCAHGKAVSPLVFWCISCCSSPTFGTFDTARTKLRNCYTLIKSLKEEICYLFKVHVVVRSCKRQIRNMAKASHTCDSQQKRTWTTYFGNVIGLQQIISNEGE